MKAIILFCIALIISSTLLFGGCSEKTYEFDQSVDQICKIELIDVGEGNDFNNFKAILEIDPNQYQGFLADFLDMKWGILHPPTSSLYGVCIKFTYSDGEYEILYDEGYYKSKPDVYKGHSNIDYDTWKSFLKKYGVEWKREYGVETWCYVD